MAFLCPSDLNPTVHRKGEGVALLQHRTVSSTATPQSVSSKQPDSPESTPRDSRICKRDSRVLLCLAKQQNTHKLWTDTGNMQGGSMYQKQLRTNFVEKKCSFIKHCWTVPNRTVVKRVKKPRNSWYYQAPCTKVGAPPCQRTLHIIQSFPCRAF